MEKEHFSLKEEVAKRNSVATNRRLLEMKYLIVEDATGTEEFLKIIRYVIIKPDDLYHISPRKL